MTGRAGRTAVGTVTERVTVLVPAHDEQDALPRTLESVARQTVRPARVVVVADNCTDRTVEVAEALGAEVQLTVENADRKAGALNQALRTVSTDLVLVLDADTTIVPGFVAEGLALLDADVGLAAVGGVFVGEEPRGFLGRAQANEYERYRTQIDVTGRTAVLTGTAALMRRTALDTVAVARGTVLPGARGDVYDRSAITEDSELTLALRTLGFRLASPATMRCTTELMPTWRDLHRQRVRWYKGMLDNLASYGLARPVLRYHGQQVMLTLSTLMLAVLLLLTFVSVVTGTFHLVGVWVAVGAVFWVERMTTVWGGGWRARALAAPLLPELVYDLALQTAYVHALVLHLARRDAGWNHVRSVPAAGTVERDPVLTAS